MSTKTRRSYTDEFKRQAVQMVATEGLTLADVARRLGVNAEVLRKWKARFAPAPGPAAVTPDRVAEGELRRLREEVRQLRMEREVLKKATAFFAREQG